MTGSNLQAAEAKTHLQALCEQMRNAKITELKLADCLNSESFDTLCDVVRAWPTRGPMQRVAGVR